MGPAGLEQALSRLSVGCFHQLNYGPFGSARIGLEPILLGHEPSELTDYSILQTGMRGIEPLMAIPKTAALPLGYIPLWMSYLSRIFRCPLYIRDSLLLRLLDAFKRPSFTLF